MSNKMKNILFIFLLFSCTLSLFAQEDRFSDINQIRGKEIYVTDNSPLSVAFSIINDKVKPINKIKNLNISLAGKVFSVENGVYTFKDIDYVILKGKEETILLKVEEAPLYLSSFVSKTYWQEKYDLYKDDYIYLNFKKFNQPHSKDATIEYDDLSRIEWRDLELTDSCVFYWMCEFNGVKPLENFKISSSYFEEIKDLFFVKKNDIQPYVEKYKMRLAKDKREKEISDSIANSKVRLAISLKDFIDDDDIAINVHKGDTIAVFSYNPSENKYVARFHYSNLLFKFEDY